MNKRVLPGIIFIIAAVLLILSIFDVIPSDIPWFRIIVAAFIVFIIINSIIYLSFYGIFIPISIILMLFKTNLQLEYISNFEFFLVALLLAIGCSLLFKGKKYFYTGSGTKFYFTNSNRMKKNESYENNDNGIVTYINNMSSSNKILKDIEVEKIIINNNFGQFIINIEKINIKNEYLEIYIENNFGNVVLNISKDYYVDNRLKTTLGSSDDYNYNDYDNIIFGKIVLTGQSNLGNIEVNRI